VKVLYGVRYDLYRYPDARADSPFSYSQKFNIDKNNFGPRGGVAWTLDPRTVVRASTGLMYDQPILIAYENALQFTTATTQVQTIATFIRASTQIMSDLPELEGFIKSGLPYYVNKVEEQQILSGDGTGVNLNGLITQATAFNTALLSAAAGYTRIDQIGAAAEQVDILDEVPATFVALNPRDWWNIRRTKDGFGQYILGPPQFLGNPSIWDLTPIATTAVAAGTFLVGNGDPAAVEIRDRMGMQVDISTEDADNFTKNLVTVRAEKRMALVVMRPQSFITGTFATSPSGL